MKDAGLAVASATQGIVLFTALMPGRGEVFKSVDNPDMITDVRQGEMVAGALTLGFGAFMTILSGDMIPLWVAAATVVTMVTAYEITLRMNGDTP